VHRLGRATLADPDALAAAVASLRTAHLARRPCVVLLDPAVRWDRALAPERERRPLWTLGADHRLLRDELAFLLADLLDARGGTPVWWPTVRARRLGCTASSDPTVDVRLPDGRPAHLVGGPRGPRRPGCPLHDGCVTVHRESIELVGRADVERDRPPSETLSTEQLAAVTHRAGPARVLAPAGSGKTRVLAARLRHLVHDRGVQPELITALAYNTRAAHELAGRTRDVTHAGVRPAIRTVHALGLAVCTAALGRRPHVLTGDAVVRALRDASGGRVGGHGGVPLDATLAALSEVRLGLRDPATVEAERGDVPGLTALVPRYRALLHAHRALDFDEQVHLAIALLLADPRLRQRVSRGARHLLVDEAQDLTPAFVLLVRLLAGPAQQLFAVGDDDQTIYGYAGASPRVLVDLPDAYPGATSYTLSTNHRCPPAVVTAASALLAHNTVRVAKTIRSAKDATDAAASGGRPALEVVEEPSTGLTQHLRTLLATHSPSDVAVLARVGAALLAPQVALVTAGIPVRRHVGPEVLARTGLRTALAYLRIAARPDRITAQDLADTLRRPARRLTGVIDPSSATSLARLARHAAMVDAEHRAALHRFVDDLAHLAGLVRDGADSAALVTAIRDRIGLGASLDVLDRDRVRPEGSSHGDDLDALAELATLEPDPARLPGWLADRLRDDGAAGDTHHDARDAVDAVTLSTVHRVKGREWDVVVLVGLRAGLVPHRLCDDVEEERRVLHVALTRARRHLLLVTDPARPSPFLPELLGTLRPAERAEPDEAALRSALQAWRRARAAADEVPAFLIAHDRTLDDLARRRPRDRIALRACHGIGPSKLARYGDELLALLDRPTVTPTLRTATAPSKARRGR